MLDSTSLSAVSYPTRLGRIFFRLELNLYAYRLKSYRSMNDFLFHSGFVIHSWRWQNKSQMSFLSLTYARFYLEAITLSVYLPVDIFSFCKDSYNVGRPDFSIKK
jgi:hypothetical protein